MFRLLFGAAALGICIAAMGVALSAGEQAGAQSVPTPTNTKGGFQAVPTKTPTSRIPTNTPPPTRTFTPTPTPTKPQRATNTPTPTRTATSTATPTRPVSSTRPTDTPTSGSLTAPPTNTPTPKSAQLVTPTNTIPPAEITANPDSGVITTFTATPTPFSLTGPTSTPTLGAFKAEDSEIDLIATGLEITQGIQDLQNSMPLVEGRWTVARLYLQVPAAHGSIANVRGAIGGWHGNTFLGVIYPENDPILGWDYGGRREVLDESLWFYIPQSWREGTLKLKGVVYQGNPGNMQFEPDDENNYIETTVQFHPVDPVYVRLVPEHVHEDYDGTKPETTFYGDGNESTINFVLAALFRYLPIFEMFYDPSLSFPVVFEIDGEEFPYEFNGPVFPSGHDLGSEWDFTPKEDDKFGDWPDANAQIDFLRDLSADPWADWFWYGMLDASMNTTGAGWKWTGLATNGVSSGKFGTLQNADTPWYMDYGVAIAHELSHVIMPGADHVLCDGDEAAGGGVDPNYPYPVTDTSPCSLAAIDPEGYYGFDVYWSLWSGYLSGPEVISNDPAIGKPKRGFPLMGYEQPQWADPYDYCKMLAALGVTCDPAMVLGPEAGPLLAAATAGTHTHVVPPADRVSLAGQAPGRYMHIAGDVDPASGVGSLGDIAASEAAPAGAVDESRQRLDSMALDGGRAELVFVNSAGAVLKRFPVANLEEAPHGLDAAGEHIYFGEWSELPPKAAGIELRVGGAVADRRIASASAPTVRLISPDGGSVSAPVTLEWSGSDPDGDRLLYTVLYSGDDGVNWRPILANIPYTKATLGTLMPLSGSSRGRFKVIASDGFNSSEDVSDGVVTVPDLAPLASIFSPRAGAKYPAGASVILNGSAFDMEELGLPPEGLSWESDRDGHLGEGTEIITRSLSVGIHQITLNARDGAGNTGSSTIEIEIVSDGARQVPGDNVTDELRRLFGPSGSGGGVSAGVWIAGGAGAGIVAGLAGAALLKLRKRRSTPPVPPAAPPSAV